MASREGQEEGRDARSWRLDLPKAIEERLAEGRAEREVVPLEAHGEWTAPSERPDAVAVLEEQNATRAPELLPVATGG